MTKSLFYALTLWWVLAMHMFCNTWWGPGFSLNVALIAVIYVGLLRGPWAGEIMGFLWGALVDVSFFDSLGVSALLFSGAGYLSGMMRRQLDETKAGTQALFTFAMSSLYVIFTYGLDRLFASGAQSFSRGALMQPAANAIAAPLLFWIMHRWSVLWHLEADA